MFFVSAYFQLRKSVPKNAKFTYTCSPQLIVASQWPKSWPKILSKNLSRQNVDKTVKFQNAQFYQNYRKRQLLKLYLKFLAGVIIIGGPILASFLEYNQIRETNFQNFKEIFGISTERGAYNTIIPFVDDFCDFIIEKGYSENFAKREEWRNYRHEYKGRVHEFTWKFIRYKLYRQV